MEFDDVLMVDVSVRFELISFFAGYVSRYLLKSYYTGLCKRYSKPKWLTKEVMLNNFGSRYCFWKFAKKNGRLSKILHDQNRFYAEEISA